MRAISSGGCYYLQLNEEIRTDNHNITITHKITIYYFHQNFFYFVVKTQILNTTQKVKSVKAE